MTSPHERRGIRIEIVLHARLGARSARWFQEFEPLEIPGDGVLLRGTVADQAALHGVLGRIRDLGLSLASVRVLDDDPESRDRGVRDDRGRSEPPAHQGRQARPS